MPFSKVYNLQLPSLCPNQLASSNSVTPSAAPSHTSPVNERHTHQVSIAIAQMSMHLPPSCLRHHCAFSGKKNIKNLKNKFGGFVGNRQTPPPCQFGTDRTSNCSENVQKLQSNHAFSATTCQLPFHFDHSYFQRTHNHGLNKKHTEI